MILTNTVTLVSAKERWSPYTHASVATSSAAKGLSAIIMTVDEEPIFELGINHCILTPKTAT